MSDQDHYYIYALRKSGIWIYERTVPTEYYANQRVEELKKQGYVDAKWLLNKTMEGSYY
jgi:hypothetical protein